VVAGEIPVHCRDGASRSQSVHSSAEGPVMGLEPRDAGRWMSKDARQRQLPPPSAYGLFRWGFRFVVDGIASVDLNTCSW
jgi:hypothetical protein